MKTDKELVDLFASGVDTRGITEVYMRGERFVIFKTPGHTYWADIMNPSKYAPVEYTLIVQGKWMFANGTKKKTWEGRTSRRILLKALDDADRGIW